MTEPAQFENQGLCLLVIHARDMEQSTEFYRALGLSFERHAHPPCGEHYAATVGACVFEICQSRHLSPSAMPLTFGFQVTNLASAIEAAVTHGGVLRRKPHRTDFGGSATVADPDGNGVILMESPNPSAPGS